MTFVSDMWKNFFKSKYKKVCYNQYEAVDYGGRGCMLYRHPDLYRMAKEAYARGDEYFYCEPKNPKDEYGELVLCEPKYKYVCKDELTEDEYHEIFG